MKDLKSFVPLGTKEKVVLVAYAAARGLKNRILQSKIDLNCNLLGVPIHIYLSANPDIEIVTKHKCKCGACQSSKVDEDNSKSPRLSKEDTFSELSGIVSDLEEAMSFIHKTTTGLSSAESQVLNKADIVESEIPGGISVEAPADDDIEKEDNTIE